MDRSPTQSGRLLHNDSQTRIRLPTRVSAKHLPASDRIEGMADMLDRGSLSIVGPDDRHHIEPAFLFEQPVFLEEMQGRERQSSLLLEGHGLGRIALTTGLHLNENECVAIPRDEIDLALWGPISAEDHPDLRPSKKLSGSTLAPVAEPSTQEGAEDRRPRHARRPVIVRR